MTLGPMCAVCPVKGLGEQWAPCPVPVVNRYGHPYEVSTRGRVRNTKTGRVLATRVHRTGYLVVTLARDPGTTYVHQLVALAFLGPAPRDGLPWEVDHLDFDRTRPWVENLRWLHKHVNAWRWKFWADQISPEEQAAYEDAPHAWADSEPEPARQLVATGDRYGPGDWW